jgi:DNA-binding IclR family transcriptional regulator
LNTTSIPHPESKASGSKAPALTRAFAILELVAREPGLSFTAIHSRLGLPKSSAHHLVSTLRDLGALKLRGDGGFGIGLHLFELAALTSQHRRLESEALPHLRALAREVQLTCHLGVLEGHEAVYLARVECDLDIRINSWVGKRFPLNSSALGKALLAWLPEMELDEILGLIRFEEKVPNTITDPAVLKTHLDLVRSRGWATDDEEDVLNIRCIAAPIHDRDRCVVAAISAVGTTTQIDQDRFLHLAPRICDAASAISRGVFAS